MNSGSTNNYVKIRERNLTCDRFSLLLSIGKRTTHLPKKAIDNIGVKPDVFLNMDESLWIEKVVENLKRK